MSTTTAGSNAEARVADILESKGFHVIARNWRTKYAEIDIVAEKEEVIYFVEVKYRSNSRTGDGFDYITNAKLKHMVRAAEAWVLINDWNGPYELLAASVQSESATIKLSEINF